MILFKNKRFIFEIKFRLVDLGISYTETEKEFHVSVRFGIISDPQYSDIDDMKGREYRKSLEKMAEAIETFNSEDLDFVIQLGDFIDHEYESFSPALDVWSKLKHKSYHVLGNHDFCVRTPLKEKVLDTLGMDEAYYSFCSGAYRFVFLNGNGLSLNAYDAGSEMYEFSEKYWEGLGRETEWWNGAIDEKQFQWFENELQEASKEGQSVLCFCHYPLFSDGRYVLWNNIEILKLIESYPCAKLWMNGHYHLGSYTEKNDRHFLTIKGMVQFKDATYAVGELSDNSLKICGYGAEESRILKF